MSEALTEKWSLLHYLWHPQGLELTLAKQRALAPAYIDYVNSTLGITEALDWDAILLGLDSLIKLDYSGVDLSYSRVNLAVYLEVPQVLGLFVPETQLPIAAAELASGRVRTATDLALVESPRAFLGRLFEFEQWLATVIDEPPITKPATPWVCCGGGEIKRDQWLSQASASYFEWATAKYRRYALVEVATELQAQGYPVIVPAVPPAYTSPLNPEQLEQARTRVSELISQLGKAPDDQL